MKKIFFLFAMFVNVAASAQTTVQITPISATYTTTPTIQFKVSWTSQTTDIHRNKAWIFVDFQTVISPTQKGNWQPATITGTVQKTAGTVSEQSNRGFFLEGTTTNFSATVTVQLSNTGTQFNWCAYASDCPPNIGDYNNGTYTLRGTPPFTLKDANGMTQAVPDKIIAQSSLTITPVTMTDATGCPGYFCKYIGRDLYIDATHKCGLRTSGAQNWEAWIKDTRDNELYRIVLMPDNKWWLAQNVKLASYNGSTVGMVACSGCNKDECGRSYLQTEVIAARGGTGGSGANIQGVCPPDWVLPLRSDMINFFNTIQPTISWNTHTATSIEGVICYAPNLIMLLTKSDNRCGTAQDYYGWATLKPCWDSREGCEGFMTGLTSGSYENYILNNMAGTYNDCGYVTIFNTTITYYKGAVRCFRQL